MMAISGNLENLGLQDLIEFVIRDGGSARLQLTRDGRIGSIYLSDGQIHHAELSDHIDPEIALITGNSAVFEVLRWTSGEFHVEPDIEASQHSVEHSWDYLLTEGMRQIEQEEANRVFDKFPDDVLVFAGLAELTAGP